MEYNASHVITFFNKHNPPIKVVYTQDKKSQLWQGKTEYQEVEYQTVETSGFSNKKEVEADLIIQIFRAKKELNSIERYRSVTVTVSPANRTPSQALNEFTQRRNLLVDTNEETTNNGYIITKSLTYMERIFQSKAGPYVDKSYAQHKAAKGLLGQLVFVDNEAWAYYSPLDGKARFRLGDVIALEENEVVEFKGGDSSLANWTFKQAKNKIDDNENGAGCYISAFLNSKVSNRLLVLKFTYSQKGGSIYYGIHDKTSTVHGIAMTEAEKDQMTQALGHMINSQFYPKADHLVRFHFHLVLEDKNDPVYLYPDATPEVQQYIRNLEKQIDDLKSQNARLMNKPTNGSKQYVLQIIVQEGAPHAVYWYNHTVFKKVANYLTKMAPAEIEARIKQV